ncbi:MAG: hypothetical protein ABR543_06585 [Gemmatimonadaceae bacterium]
MAWEAGTILVLSGAALAIILGMVLAKWRKNRRQLANKYRAPVLVFPLEHKSEKDSGSQSHRGGGR